jgi:hypothetical protein
MSLAFRFDSNGQIVDAELQAEIAFLEDPAEMNRNVGEALVLLTQDHLRGLGPNQRFPAKTTNFWADAARLTNYRADAQGVTTAISKQGVTQRYFGGEIKAKPGSYLTIPAREEYYGRRAREFNNLRFAILPGQGPVLIEAERTELRSSRRRKGETVSDFAQTADSGGVAYWLRRRVKQDANPDVLPPRLEIGATAVAAIRDFLQTKRRLA